MRGYAPPLHMAISPFKPQPLGLSPALPSTVSYEATHQGLLPSASKPVLPATRPSPGGQNCKPNSMVSTPCKSRFKLATNGPGSVGICRVPISRSERSALVSAAWVHFPARPAAGVRLVKIRSSPPPLRQGLAGLYSGFDAGLASEPSLAVDVAWLIRCRPGGYGRLPRIWLIVMPG